MIKSYLLFTAPFCKFCPAVTEYLSKMSLTGTMLDATKEGIEKAVNLKVHTVPTVIFLDERGDETGRAHSIHEIKSMFFDD